LGKLKDRKIELVRKGQRVAGIEGYREREGRGEGEGEGEGTEVWRDGGTKQARVQ